MSGHRGDIIDGEKMDDDQQEGESNPARHDGGAGRGQHHTLHTLPFSLSSTGRVE